MPRPTDERPSSAPWPTYPMIFRVSSAHEESDNRIFSVSTEEFLGDADGNLRALKIVETEFKDGKFSPVPGTEREIPAQFAFLAMGFTGPEQNALIKQLEVELDDRGNIKRDANYFRVAHGNSLSIKLADEMSERLVRAIVIFLLLKTYQLQPLHCDLLQ